MHCTFQHALLLETRSNRIVLYICTMCFGANKRTAFANAFGVSLTLLLTPVADPNCSVFWMWCRKRARNGGVNWPLNHSSKLVRLDYEQVSDSAGTKERPNFKALDPATAMQCFHPERLLLKETQHARNIDSAIAGLFS